MRLHRTLYLLTLTIFLFLLTNLAYANFQVGKDAYDRGDYETALREWRPLAKQGDADAQYNLGLMNYLGQGVLQNYVMAHVWFILAAAQGHKNAAEAIDQITRKMTLLELAEVRRRAREWLIQQQK
jgi:TPR repeat protein